MAPHDRLRSDDALGGAGAPRVSAASAKSAAQPPRASAARDGLWQDIYPHLTGPQQLELLALADRQGVVYAHQLPEARKDGDSGKDSSDSALRALCAANSGILNEFGLLRRRAKIRTGTWTSTSAKPSPERSRPRTYFFFEALPAPENVGSQRRSLVGPPN